MRILHTSDWHIGRALYGRKRYEAFEAFLDWLADTIAAERVDALLVAGDVFDTGTPSNRAQGLYYRFLCRVAQSACRHVVVIAGNHDSPSFLNAPRDLLRALQVHVIGEACDDEVLVLEDGDGRAELIVCAVPYLRDRDIRVVDPGESIADKERKLIEGIRAHYRDVCESARQRREAADAALPIVAMGHLFTQQGSTVEGDGVRELYVGSLARVSAEIFPACIDYVALGHLHVPQKVNGSEILRYSGAPLPMGFGEARQEKSVCLVDFGGSTPLVTGIRVPVFQPLECIRGCWEVIATRLAELSNAGSTAWLEIIYEGDEVIGDLKERVDAAIACSRLEVLRIKNSRIIHQALGRIHVEETLDDLTVHDVFDRCLDMHQVPEEQRADLRAAYREVLASMQEAN